LRFFYDNFLPLLTSANLLALLISIFVYVRAKASPQALLALGGNSGIFVYDFFIGHELNPRIGDFDFKYFCELRPGLIGWALLNFGLAAKQYEMKGSVHIGMILVCIFEGIYVLDALYFEPAILTTMDITTDGFGFMLAFGDLSWVPFIYSTQARYLVDNDPGYGLDSSPTSIAFVTLIVGLKVLGYWMFRGSNSEKNAFRTNPNDPSISRKFRLYFFRNLMD
jgi:delta14-sterol reductase